MSQTQLGLLERGFGDGVGGVGDRGRDAALVPADGFVVDCVFEAVFVVVRSPVRSGRGS